MITEETYNKIQEILIENTDEDAGKLGVILTEVIWYMLDNYQVSPEDMLKSVERSIEIIKESRKENE